MLISFMRGRVSLNFDGLVDVRHGWLGADTVFEIEISMVMFYQFNWGVGRLLLNLNQIVQIQIINAYVFLF